MPEVNLEQTTPKSSSSLKLVLVALGIFALVGVSAYAGYWYGKQQVPPPATTPEVSTPPVTEVPESTPPAETDETAGWKVYTGDKLEFKYPETFTLEERQKDYFVLLSDAANPQSVVFWIDAMLVGGYANYEGALASTKANLTFFQPQEFKSWEIAGGTKITGRIGPEYGKNQAVTIALLKYQEGAVEIETTSTDPDQLRIFDQILSTFKFLD